MAVVLGIVKYPDVVAMRSVTGSKYNDDDKFELTCRFKVPYK